jgi:hypothetical protein
MSAADWAWILGSGAGTALGGLGLLAFRRPSEWAVAALLGLTGGVMVGAALAGLLVPAFERGQPAEVVAGLVAGAVAKRVADALVPHVHWGFVEPGRGAREARSGSTQRAVMLLTALTIHNVPEGLASHVEPSGHQGVLACPRWVIRDSTGHVDAASGLRENPAADAGRQRMAAPAPSSRVVA